MWNALAPASRPAAAPAAIAPADQARVVYSFDVEEHFRIEAAAGLDVDPALRGEYAARVEPATRLLLDALAEHGRQATFFIVGELAQSQPRLVRAIDAAGHEVASHGWDHQRLHNLSPATFHEDVRKSKDALEQITGKPVLGYRAPTFSIVRQTAWGIDQLVQLGFRYDSSIYPVRHDRYGVPGAPRGPFLARGNEHEILELPPASLRLPGGVRLPMGGGGYFRLFPRRLFDWTIRQTARQVRPAVAVLYFHPWEFEPDQPRLPLGRLSRWRTYIGLARSRSRLRALLERCPSIPACQAAAELDRQRPLLPAFAVGHQA